MLSRLGPPQEEKFDVNKCKLSVEDVSNKLKEWALDDFIPTFKKNAVDGPLLVSLKEEEFEKDLGVESRLIRRKLMQKIDELKSSVTNRDAYANVLFGFLQDGKITNKEDIQLAQMRTQYHITTADHEKLLSEAGSLLTSTRP